MFKRKQSRSESEESPNVGKHTRVDPEPLANPPKNHNHKPVRVDDTENMAAYQIMVFMHRRNSPDKLKTCKLES